MNLKKLPFNSGVIFQAPIPPSRIHCPKATSSSAYGTPTAMELTINGIRKAPI